jgi:hypothetical protein
MFTRSIARLLGLAAFAGLVSLPAQAGRLLDIEVVDRNSGEVLPMHRHAGQYWVAGQPGARFAVRMVNRTGGRLLAVLSVDGVNAVTGETAAPDQSGYLLEPYASAEIAGWRKNLDDVARFYFTRVPDSYAARTDRPDNVGVIGVAVFREKVQAPIIQQPQVLPAPARPEAGMARDQEAARDGNEYKAQSRSERLGTGHGEREYAPTRYAEFERAGSRPNEVVSLRYDSHANLVARGVIPDYRSRPYEPRPFPGGFVPDPRG